MAKLRKDVRVEIEGAQLHLKTYPATVTLSTALGSTGVDYKPTLAAILKLDKHAQRLLEDKAVRPIELDVPYPDAYSDDQAADLCGSLAASIRSDREFRWNRGTAVAGVIVGVVGAVAAVLALALC